MAGRFDFRSPGAALSSALGQALLQQEAARRQSMLDGIFIEDKQRAQAKADLEAQRQAKADQRAAMDQQQTLTHEEGTFADE